MILGALQSLYLEPTLAKPENKPGQVLPPLEVGSKSKSVETHFETSNSLAGISQQYDIRNMAHKDMADMSFQLYENDVITFEDHALLSLQPNKILQGLEGEQADVPKDFIAYWQAKKQFHVEQGQTKFAEKDQRIINILGNLDALSEQSNVDDAV